MVIIMIIMMIIILNLLLLIIVNGNVTIAKVLTGFYCALLDIKYLSSYQLILIAIFTYKYPNNLLPRSFGNFFKRSSDIRSHRLLSVDKHRPEVSRTTLKKDFQVSKCSGPRMFSSIPVTIASSESISIFKCTC